MNTLPEIKIQINPAAIISNELVIAKNELELRSKSITRIVTNEDNAAAGRDVVDMRKHVKEIESLRKQITTPLDDAKKIIKDFCDNHSSELNNEIIRLQKMATAFLESEQRRIAAEEQKRQDEFREAQRKQFELDEAARKAAESGNKFAEMMAQRQLETAKNQVQEIIAAPTPTMEKAKGQTMKRVLKFEVTDIFALVKARPDLCKIEAKASAINSSCHPDHPVPGLRLYWENQSVFTTR